MAKKGNADQNKNFQKKMEGKKQSKPSAAPSKEPEQIIRLLNTDLNGRRSISNGLRNIKGISFPMANIILKKTSIPPSTNVSDLSEEQISQIEQAVKNPGSFGIPEHMLNSRRFVETNESSHLTGSDLDIFLRNHLENMKKLGSYVGIRHRQGKKVRGQRTRSTGRGQKSVGVSKRRK